LADADVIAVNIAAKLDSLFTTWTCLFCAGGPSVRDIYFSQVTD